MYMTHVITLHFIAHVFKLCFEGLSSLISKGGHDGAIMCFVWKWDCLRVSHLFLFATDSLLFCRATQEEVVTIRKLSAVCNSSSEQQINFVKSFIVFIRVQRRGLKM